MLNKYLNITITNVKITIINKDQEKKIFLRLYLFFINCKYFILKFYLAKILSIKLLLVNGNILSIELENFVKK